MTSNIETQLRRRAHRYGLRLAKSRSTGWTQRTYGLVDIATNAVVAHCGDGYGLTLDAIADELDRRA